MMRNVCCTVQYDGTDFKGFQRQPDVPTIQGELEKAVTAIAGTATPIHGAGRTDAGVHAHAQVFHFHTRVNVPTERWPYALNSRLPPTIVVTKAHDVPADFHARKSAVGKVYDYVIYNDTFPSVVHDRFSLFIKDELDVEAMREAARHLVGKLDFAAFRATGSTPVHSTVRHMRRLEIVRDGAFITITAKADGFLYHMMRNIVGSLLLVGQGRQPSGWIRDVLRSGRRELAGPTAPARGLFLNRVKYC